MILDARTWHLVKAVCFLEVCAIELFCHVRIDIEKIVAMSLRLHI